MAEPKGPDPWTMDYRTLTAAQWEHVKQRAMRRARAERSRMLRHMIGEISRRFRAAAGAARTSGHSGPPTGAAPA